MYIWNISTRDIIYTYIRNRYNLLVEDWEWAYQDGESIGDGSIHIRINEKWVLVKVGDYLIVNSNGTYFNDLQYLKNNV